MSAEPNSRMNLAVIGGGPAGLRAAEVAAGGGASVTVFDAQASVGRKFRGTGRIKPDAYRGLRFVCREIQRPKPSQETLEKNPDRLRCGSHPAMGREFGNRHIHGLDGPGLPARNEGSASPAAVGPTAT